jgi:uncharacterized membrane protein YbaN (DUF454 family)
MKRILYLIAGWLSVGLGIIGIVLPLMPTVPFMILAAFCFARSSPKFEAWLVNHPQFGPHILRWRQNGAISRKGKYAASIAFSISAIIGVIFIKMPWGLAPLAVATIGISWIWSRPDR